MIMNNECSATRRISEPFALLSALQFTGELYLQAEGRLEITRSYTYLVLFQQQLYFFDKRLALYVTYLYFESRNAILAV